MGAVIDGKPDKPTLALIDDLCTQALNALVLGLVARTDNLVPAELTDVERAAVLKPHARTIEHYAFVLRGLVRQAAGLGEEAVLREMDQLGVERELLAVVTERRRP